MPTAPFGLAYGLGAGMAIAPQQMFNRQQQANQLAMQGLQQQLLQHQVAQQQAEERAFSQPVAPQTETVPTYGTETEQMPAAMTPEGKPFEAAGTIPIQRQVQTGTETRPVQHVTPYQKMAYELGQRADKLASMGFGRSAMALQQQAADAAMKHQSVALQQAGRAVMSGNYDSAIPYLNSVGFNVSDIREDPDNPGNLIMSHPDGNESVVPRQAAQMIAADPSQAASAMAMIEYRKAMAGAAGTRAGAYGENVQSQIQHRKDLKEHYERMDARAQKAFGAGYNTLPAAQKNAIWYARLHNISEKEASDLFVPGASRNMVTSSKALSALTQVNKQISQKYSGMVPDINSNDPVEKQDAALYADNLQQITQIGQEIATSRGKREVGKGGGGGLPSELSGAPQNVIDAYNAGKEVTAPDGKKFKKGA